MKLTVGSIAPVFQTEDVFGASFALEEYVGQTVLVSFFRNGACAICNLRIHHLIQKYPDYRERGLEIVAVFESPRESVLQYVTKQNVPFPIIADPTATLYDHYGVESSEEKVMVPVDMGWRTRMIQEAASIGYPLQREEGSNFFRLPADFVIGPDGRIEAAFYANVVGEHLSFEEIEAYLQNANNKLQIMKCPVGTDTQTA